VEAPAPADPTPAEAIRNVPASEAGSKLSPAPAVTAPVVPDGADSGREVDEASRDWLGALTAAARTHGDGGDAVARLEALLVRASRFEVARRQSTLPHSPAELDRVARDASADSLAHVLARLDEYDGASRFSTWAVKFALQETAIRLRELGWQERRATDVELPSSISRLLDAALSKEQREVFTALSFRGMPIDVLADDLHSTRAAVYGTLHDARRRLRRHLGERH
jgi:RNA polymerase sigma-70 factor, ECF subfamily